MFDNMRVFCLSLLHHGDEGVNHMQDQLTATYGDLLQGSYDCPDRIVLNAYFRMGYSPGGFRHWWRRLHGSDDNLDKSHLMRMAGRFGRRLKAYAQQHDIPVEYCDADERKHELAEQYLPEDPAFTGLFLVIVSRATGAVWDVKETADGRIHSLDKKYRFINHYFFHIVDPQWGHVSLDRPVKPVLSFSNRAIALSRWPMPQP
jgi:hypothetical protein